MSPRKVSLVTYSRLLSFNSSRDAAVAQAHAESETLKDQLLALETELQDLRSRSSQQEALHLEEVKSLQAEIQEAQAQAPTPGSGDAVDMETFESESKSYLFSCRFRRSY